MVLISPGGGGASTAGGIGSGFTRRGEYATSSLPPAEIAARSAYSSTPAGSNTCFTNALSGPMATFSWSRTRSPDLSVTVASRCAEVV